MKLIVGLGNPGRDYESTRHNVGWWLLDKIANEWSFEPWKKDLDTMVTSRRIGGRLVRLMKPLTYMNLSGNALRPYLRREAFSVAQDMLVVVDDVAIPLGSIRLRASGSAGGHNGLKSIEQATGTLAYARMRIGIRPPAEREGSVRQLSDFVLGPFSKGERSVLDQIAPQLTQAVDTWLIEGIDKAMRDHNGSSPSVEPG